MSYGKIEYNDEGLPMCEICGEHFNRVSAHVRQIHGMSAREYKKHYGFDLIKGICSKESAERTRVTTIANFDKVIAENLIKGGEKTRFKDGCKGRTKDKISPQTLRRLKTNSFPPKKSK